MRRRRGWIAAVLAALALWAWWLWPSAQDPATAKADAAPSPVDAAATEAPTAGGRAPGRRRGARTSNGEAVLDPTQAPIIVQCALPPEVAEVGPSGAAVVGGVGSQARVQGAWLVLQAPPANAEGRADGRLRLDGYASTSVRLVWDKGAWLCDLGELIPSATISGRVLTDRDAEKSRITVSGCGRPVRVDRDGGFFLDIDPEPCELRATWRDGMFTLRSDPVPVDPRSGEEVVLDLRTPAWRGAGVGTQIRTVDEGVEIMKVWADTPAERAGLQPGDVVVALDGAPVAGWSTEEFVDVAVGPAGSEVVYTVLRDGEQVQVTMKRAELSFPR